jgi:excisionase family DNA binding protein
MAVIDDRRSSQPEALLTTVEVAKILRIGRSAVVRLVDDGSLIAVKVSPRCTRFRPADVHDFLDAHASTVPRPEEP